MNQYEGEIFSGEFDQDNQSFYLKEVKSIGTGSDLSAKQLNQLYEYVKQQDESCMLTVNDQMPVLIPKSDLESLRSDLSYILAGLNDPGMEGSKKHV